MKFALSEEQQFFQQTLRRLFEDKAPSGGRAPGADSAAEWRQRLAELGAFGTLVPRQAGGSGLGLLEAALVGEEIGRACAPICWHGAGVMAPLALAGTEAADPWLARLASGDALLGIATSPAARAQVENPPRASGDNTLDGLALMATDAPGADAWIVETADQRLWLVEDAEAEAMPTIDASRQFGSLEFAATPARPLPNADPERLLQAGRIALAAETLGAAEHMLYRAVSYASEREQFGRVIGSFQAVKHLCAEMAAELEPARALIWYAAHAWDLNSEDAPLFACHARAVTAEAASFIARAATEAHGGIGFTDEYGLHSWFKRIGCNRQLLGGPDRVRDEAARLQGWL